MKTMVVLALSGFLMLDIAPAKAATVTVSFIHPETYTDAAWSGGYSIKAEQPTLDEISRYLETLGDRYLGPGQALAIEVLNVDLAGQYETWRGTAHDVRIIRDIYPPRITVRYRLTDGGRPVINGRDVVTDINYLSNPATSLIGDSLRYEKAMLETWFKATFV
jgi:hypothetical protein